MTAAAGLSASLWRRRYSGGKVVLARLERGSI
jgi:hypothetical protein